MNTYKLLEASLVIISFSMMAFMTYALMIQRFDVALSALLSSFLAIVFARTEHRDSEMNK